MLNAFFEWLIRNWNTIIEVFMWGLTVLMAFIIAAKIFKIVKLKFEAMDAVGLVFAGLWILAIIFFGFDHIRLYLQGFL